MISCKTIRTYAKKIFSVFHCSFCKKLLSDDHVLCNACKQSIKKIIPIELEITEKVRVPIYAIGAYENPLAALILEKYLKNESGARELGLLMAESLFFMKDKIDYLIPVPLHWTRYAWRGFNQSEIISNTLAHTWDKKTVCIVKRTKFTKYQTHTKTILNRIQNVKNVFLCTIEDKEVYYKKNLCIIDDLMTTGSTLREVARSLLFLKPASISIIVASRVIK